MDFKRKAGVLWSTRLRGEVNSSREFLPMSVHSGTSNQTEVPRQHAYVWAEESNSSIISNHNIRGYRVASLHEALNTMSTLPDDNDFYVEPASAHRAAEILGLIAQNFEFVPPKVMPLDREAVVFTWEKGDIKSYLTIDQDEVSVMELDRAKNIRCVHNTIISDDLNSYLELIKIIGANPASSSYADQDA